MKRREKEKHFPTFCPENKMVKCSVESNSVIPAVTFNIDGQSRESLLKGKDQYG